MNILAINNYSLEECLRKSSEKLNPAHHNWGVDYLKSRGHNVQVLTYTNKGTRIKKDLLFSLLFTLKNFAYFRQFDIIIAFANPILGWVAFFKKIGFLKVHLYTLVHHYVNHMLLNDGYDGIFFLSTSIMELTKKRYPKLSVKMNYLEWGPDLPFYEHVYQSVIGGGKKCGHKEKREITLISNGKTSRDLQLVTKGLSKLSLPVIIITDKAVFSNAVVSGQKGVNAISYQELLGYMQQSDVSLIPISADRPGNSLCGLTSVLDALALGQPIIMSDNTNISIDIEKEKIGLLYKAGDETDFINKVKYMIGHPDFMKECGRNARLYAEKHSYLDYCKRLEQLITG